MNVQGGSVDRTTRAILATIALLLGVIAVGLWDRTPDVLPTAAAQIPDTGKQRQEILVEARRTNQLLEGILTHLQTRTVVVKFAEKGQSENPPAGGK